MILNYKLTTSVPLHSEKNPGVNCLDINTDLDDLLITGGQDGTVVLYNRAQDKVNPKKREKYFNSLDN